MDNWLFFLIIGIGIVSSFLNKKTKTISQGPITKPIEVETPSTNYFPDRKEEARRKEFGNNRTETKKIDTVQHFEGTKENKVESVKKRDAYSDESIKDNLTAFKHEPNQVAQGIIWSEILGPPRSKRPHNLRQR